MQQLPEDLSLRALLHPMFINFCCSLTLNNYDISVTRRAFTRAHIPPARDPDQSESRIQTVTLLEVTFDSHWIGSFSDNMRD